MTPEEQHAAHILTQRAQGLIEPTETLEEQERILHIAREHHRLRALGYEPTADVPLGVYTLPALGVVLEYGSRLHEVFLTVGLVEKLSRDRLRVSNREWCNGQVGGWRGTFGPGFVARRIWCKP